MFIRLSAGLLVPACILLADSRAVSAEEKDVRVAAVIPHAVHLRSKPDIEKAPSSWAPKGTVMEVTGETRDEDGRRWYRVRKPRGGEYWIVARMVKITVKTGKPEQADHPPDTSAVAGKSAPGAGEKKIAVVIVPAVTMRAGPSLKAKAEAWGKKGDSFEIAGETADSAGRKWFKARTGKGRELWLRAVMVSLSNAAAGAETVEKPAAVEPAKIIEMKPPAAADRKEPPDMAVSLQDQYDKAGALLAEGKYEECIGAYGRAVKAAVKKSDTVMEGRFLYNLAECYTATKKFREATESLDKAVAAALSANDREIEALARIDKCRVLLISGDKNAAAEAFARASGWAERRIFLNRDAGSSLKAVVSYHMAHVLFAFGEKDKGVEKLNYAFTMNTIFALEDEMVAMLKKMNPRTYDEIAAIEKEIDGAWTSYDKGNFSAMEKHARNVLDASAGISYKKGIFSGDYCLAISFINREIYDKAAEHAIHAQELAVEGKDEVRLGMVFNLTGNIFKQKAEFEKALHFYEKYLAIAKRKGSRESEAAALNNIGMVLMEKGLYSDALSRFKDSLKASLEAGVDKHLIAQGYLGVGRASKKLADFESAEKNFNAAVAVFRESGNEGGMLLGLWESAGNYAMMGAFPAAIRILEDNLPNAEKHSLKKKFLDELINCAEKSHDAGRLEKYRTMKEG